MRSSWPASWIIWSMNGATRCAAATSGLAAVRSFLKFAARRESATCALIEQALAVPMKRFDRKMVGFLTRGTDARGDRRADADVDRPARPTAAHTDVQHRCPGVRDHRRSRRQTSCSVRLRASGCTARGASSVRCRCGRPTANEVRDWLHLNRAASGKSPLLPRRDGKPMTRANVAQRLKLAVQIAATATRRNWPGCRCPRTSCGTQPR